MGCVVTHFTDKGEHLIAKVNDTSERLKFNCALICCLQNVEQLLQRLNSSDNYALYDANGLILYAKKENIIIS